MRVAIAGDYPEEPPSVMGGIQAVIYNSLPSLAEYDDLELHVVTCEKWRSRSFDGPEVVRHGRWTVHYLPSSPRLPHTFTMLTLDRLAVHRELAALAPDLIHAHGQAVAYPFAAFDTGLPTVVTVHGINTLEAQVDPRGGAIKGWLRTALWGLVERQCLRRARDLIVISPFVQRVIEPYTRARLHVIENAVHEDFAHLTPEPEPGKVLVVGSIQKRKGILEAVQAISLVREQVPEARLYVAGAFLPPYRTYGEMVRQYVAETGATSYVHFLGQVGHRELVEAYRTSQVFLFPTFLEASPVALEEAMAAGLPSVVSDIGGTAHLVEDDVTGYRVPVGDVKALAARTTHLLQDQNTCRRFGERAREIAKSRFAAHLAAQRLHDLYLSLVGSQP